MQPIHVFLLLSAVALLAGLYKIFEKAGEKGWKALIPIYNFVVWLRLIKKPWWWIFLVLIPTVGFYMLAIMIVLLSNCFGKRKFSEHVIAVLAYFIWIPYLGFSKTIKWQGVPPEEKKRPMAKEWGEAAVFAIVAATLIRTFFFEAFVIPSSSMEGTLMVGDYLFVSKLSYGAKVPAIPLTIPFTHNTLPFTETTPSYVDWIELPEIRFPALNKVERNDIVVFNFPEGDTVYRGERNMSYYSFLRRTALQNMVSTDFVRKIMVPDSIVVHPVDKEDNYVKRCVAVPGDVLEVRDRELMINGKSAMVPDGAQWAYKFNAPIENENDYKILKAHFESVGVTDEFGRTQYTDSSFTFTIPVHESRVQAFKEIIGETTPDKAPKSFWDFDCFPHDTNYKWNRDNFGPITIPKKGVTVTLIPKDLPFWERIIKVYEGNTLEIKDGKYILNGQPSTTYTFKQDYYFMMGDNRHNSLDSRYWGFVPANHIVGKPVFVWFSKGQHTGIRPERMMTFVSREGLSKSYLWWVIGGIAAMFIYGQVKSRRKEKQKPASKAAPKKK